ncbi:MAG TPA: hypothetical protein VLA89_07945 [Gemmatimonadales bacterium]|nr:hypothetical protein [Gemmatimonadales bacterium]
MDLIADLAKVRRGHRGVIDRALARLARWIEDHPSASVEEIEATEEYGRVLEEFDAEINDLHGALVEVLPAMIEDVQRGRA